MTKSTLNSTPNAATKATPKSSDSTVVRKVQAQAKNNLNTARKVTETVKAQAEETLNTTQKVAEEATKNAEKTLKDAHENVEKAQVFGIELFEAYSAASRSMFQGIVEMDKALIDYAHSAIAETVEVNKAALKSADPVSAFHVHSDFVQKRVEKTGEEIKKLAVIAQNRSEEAWKPVLSVFEDARKKFIAATTQK